MFMNHSNVSVIGFFLASNGLGQAARNISHSLNTTQISSSCIDINYGAANLDNEFYEKCSGYIPDQVNFVISGIDLAELISEQLLTLGLGHKNYYYPYWELDRIPTPILRALTIYDKVVAPSHFVANTFQKYLDYKVPVIHQPVLIPKNILINQIKDGVLKIFCMMDFGSFIARKNPKAALDAFLMAFPLNQKNVELTIKIKGDRDVGLRNYLAVCMLSDSRLKVIDGDLGRDEISTLISECNIYLSLHRSEGFGFGSAEAMAAGKIVVATEYGGVTDFLNDFTGYPISYRLVPIQEGEYIYSDNQMWAEPSVSHAASVLQDIYMNFDRAVKRANNGRELMLRNFSFNSVGKQLKSFLERY